MKAEHWAASPSRFRVEDARDGRLFSGNGFARPLSAAWPDGRSAILALAKNGAENPRSAVACEPKNERAAVDPVDGAGKGAGEDFSSPSSSSSSSAEVSLPSFAPPFAPAGAVITGGAGFLGCFLVRELLARPGDGLIHVVARRPEALWGNLRAQLGDAEARAAQSNPRVRLISADLSRPECVAAVLRAIGDGEVSRVYHLAAQVHAFSSRARLAPANEAGTRHAIEIARAFRAGLTHISTLSVFVSSDARGEAREEWLGEDPETRLFGGYAQTKAAAESLVAQAMAQGLDAQVARLGLLMPRDGSKLAPDHFMGALLRALMGLRMVPSTAEEALVDFTPADQAAQGIAAIAQSGMSGVFHYANPESATLTQLVQALAHALARAPGAPELKVVADDAWDAAVSELPSLSAALLESAFRKSRFLAGRASARPLFNADLFQSTDRSFGIARALAAGAPRPDDPRALIERHVNDFVSFERALAARGDDAPDAASGKSREA